MSESISGNRNVIDLTKYLGDTRFSVVSEVEAYWEGLRAGRLMPRRSEVDPRGIERALEFAFILERIAPGLARFRIAGSHLSEILGMEVRGLPLGTFFDPADRRAVNDALETVFDGPAMVTIDLLSERSIGKPEMTARMILLPLKSDLGDVTRVLGCLATQGEIGRAPRRFRVQSVNLRHIGALVRDQQREEEEQAAKPLTHLAEDCAVFTPRVPEASRRSGKHLRLVTTDD